MISEVLQTYKPKFERAADGLAIATAVAMPWSVSASGILIALWVLAVLPTLDGPVVRDTLRSPAAAVAVAKQASA